MSRLLSTLGAIAIPAMLTAETARVFAVEETSANDFHVALDGNDGNPGTETELFAAIQAAVNRLRSSPLPEGGTTVWIRGGSYHETVSINGLQGLATAPITIRSCPGETLTLDGTEAISDLQAND